MVIPGAEAPVGLASYSTNNIFLIVGLILTRMKRLLNTSRVSTMVTAVYRRLSGRMVPFWWNLPVKPLPGNWALICGRKEPTHKKSGGEPPDLVFFDLFHQMPRRCASSLTASIMPAPPLPIEQPGR